jgi:hypothetical protein
MDTCSVCHHWTQKRKRIYSDGTEIVYFVVLGGNGHCEKLERETEPDFGCKYFDHAPGYDHIVTDTLSNAPWECFKIGDCPDCNGRGSGLEGGACRRCAGTGKVRFYDDGYIGEEQTRRHPKQPSESTTVDPGTIIKPLPPADVF